MGATDVEHRPLYHVRPPTMWVNDPNAPVQVGDTYHLFCQYNPGAATHGDIAWAHVTSTDLVHWRLHDPALRPDPDGADPDGCWSGSAVLVDGRPALVYSGYHDDRAHQNVCVAWPADNLQTWEKDRRNPVIEGPPPELPVTEFRDPFVWVEPGGYACLIGAGLRPPGPPATDPAEPDQSAVLLYRSPDLVTWTFTGIYCRAEGPVFDGLQTGAVWECPNLARWGDRGLLLVSVWRPETGPDYAAVMSGTVGTDSFAPTEFQPLDYGPDLYAPAITVDDTGRSLLWGWIREGRPDAVAAADGWAGALTVPRLLSIDDEGRPCQQPAPELAALRGPERRWTGTVPGDRADVVLAPDAGDSLEVVVTLTPAGAGRSWIRLRSSPDWAEYTEVGVDSSSGEVYLSREASSLDDRVHRGTYRVAAAVDADRPTRLQVYLDRSVLEVFVDDRHVLTGRIYPTRVDSTGLAIGATGCDAAYDLRVWPISTAVVSSG